MTLPNSVAQSTSSMSKSDNLALVNRALDDLQAAGVIVRLANLYGSGQVELAVILRDYMIDNGKIAENGEYLRLRNRDDVRRTG